jgi:hypothetical protein
MDYLYINAQVLPTGYPIILFYLIAIIGLILIFIKPYWAFLFSAFCLAAKNYHAAVFTRVTSLGPYLNLNDLLEWIAIIAMVVDLIKFRRKIWVPGILLIIFGLITIGDLQSLIKYGFEEEVLRRIWGISIFPIMFLTSTNMVFDENRAKRLFWALFLGAVFAAIQHMFFIQNNIKLLINNYSELRIISYLFSGGIYYLIFAIYFHLETKKRFLYAFYYIGLGLIFISFIFSFTRTYWISAFVSTFLVYLIIKNDKISFKPVIRFTMFLTIGIIFIYLFFSQIELTKIIIGRIETITTKEKFLSSYDSRQKGMSTELSIWFNSSIILGCGSSLPLEYERADPLELETSALGHVAFATYLAHFGLIGILVYLFLLPYQIIKITKIIISNDLESYRSRVAIVALVSSLTEFSAFLSSECYLAPTKHIPGILYGATFGLYKNLKNHKLSKQIKLKCSPKTGQGNKVQNGLP